MSRFVDELPAVRRQRKGVPDTANAALAQSGGLGQRVGGGLMGVVRLRFQRACQHTFHFRIAQTTRVPG